MKGILYLVAVPIGNYDDITLRGLNTLRTSDIIICEEYKEARRLLSHYQIQKELISLNEHNEKDVVPEIITKLKEGKSCALISDAGTPLFSDPGHYLAEQCILSDIQIISIPGANSLLIALTGSGFNFERFYYYGWLSPKKEERRKELQKLKSIKEVIVILDTPYRLAALMSDIVRILGPNSSSVIAFQLTMENEEYFRGTTGKLLSIVEERKLKGEYVLIIDNTR